MPREEKLAHGAKIAKKIKTIALSPRQQGMRINLGLRGVILISRDIDGFVVCVEASDGTSLEHYDHDGERACKIELTKVE